MPIVQEQLEIPASWVQCAVSTESSIFEWVTSPLYVGLDSTIEYRIGLEFDSVSLLALKDSITSIDNIYLKHQVSESPVSTVVSNVYRITGEPISERSAELIYSLIFPDDSQWGTAEDSTGSYTTKMDNKVLESPIEKSHLDVQNVLDNDLTHISLIIDDKDASAAWTTFSSDFSLLIDYTARTLPSRPTVRIIQTDASTVEQSVKTDETQIRVSGNHSLCQYQIVLGHQTFDNPLINLYSNADIRRNGNVSILNQNDLNIILKFNTEYKIRTRVKDEVGWSSWSRPQTFRTRDKDYKYRRGS